MPWPNRRALADYPGVNYIHPLRQREVEQLIEKPGSVLISLPSLFSEVQQRSGARLSAT